MSNSDGMKAAQKLWRLLGKPDHTEAMLSWDRVMGDCLGETKYDLSTFINFLDYCVNIDRLAVQNLRTSTDPAAYLKRNLPNLTRFFDGYRAQITAKDKRDVGLGLKPPVRPKTTMTHDPNCGWCRGSGRSNPNLPGQQCACTHWQIDGKNISFYDWCVATGVNLNSINPKLVEKFKGMK